MTPPNSPSLHPVPEVPTRHQNDETSILRSFLDGMGYESPIIQGTNEQLEAAMRDEMGARNIYCDQLEKTLHLAASLIELAYHNCNFEEKKNIALFNWYLIYVDDMSTKNPAPFSVFEERFLRSQPQLDPVLDALVGVLLCMWEHYDSLCANSILAATFEFATTHCIEPEIEALPLVCGGQRFTWFLRERIGAVPAFAFMLFPKTRKLDILEYIQAMPDMNFWISVTNGLLSFHKEELAGEKSNYVHMRAYVENKAPRQVLAEMVGELHSSRKTILATLADSPDALEAWKVWERGYVLSVLSFISER